MDEEVGWACWVRRWVVLVFLDKGAAKDVMKTQDMSRAGGGLGDHAMRDSSLAVECLQVMWEMIDFLVS